LHRSKKSLLDHLVGAVLRRTIRDPPERLVVIN
jgi:hypothetical protein